MGQSAALCKTDHCSAEQVRVIVVSCTQWERNGGTPDASAKSSAFKDCAPKEPAQQMDVGALPVEAPHAAYLQLLQAKLSSARKIGAEGLASTCGDPLHLLSEKTTADAGSTKDSSVNKTKTSTEGSSTAILAPCSTCHKGQVEEAVPIHMLAEFEQGHRELEEWFDQEVNQNRRRSSIWGPEEEGVSKGKTVCVTEPFQSDGWHKFPIVKNTDERILLKKGTEGFVKELNCHGHAIINFEGIQKSQWVSKSNLKKLKVLDHERPRCPLGKSCKMQHLDNGKTYTCGICNSDSLTGERWHCVRHAVDACLECHASPQHMPKVGDRIVVFDAFHTSFPGRVTAVNYSGTFAVQLDNGNHLPDVLRDSLRKVEKIATILVIQITGLEGIVVGTNEKGEELFSFPRSDLSEPLTAKKLQNRVNQIGGFLKDFEEISLFEGALRLASSDKVFDLDSVVVRATRREFVTTREHSANQQAIADRFRQ